MDKEETKTKKKQMNEASVKDALKQTRSASQADQGKKKLTDEQKAAAEAEKQRAKEERLRLREEKKAQRSAERKPAHMRKVENAAARLPKLTPDLEALAAQLGALDAAAVEAFIANVQHRLRVRATEKSTNITLINGQLVRIVSGDVRFVGQLARVTEARRIRCHVTPLGSTKKVYLLNSDVEVVSEAETGAPAVDEGDAEAPQAKTA